MKLETYPIPNENGEVWLQLYERNETDEVQKENAGYLPSAGSGAAISCGDQEATVIKKLEASGAIILGVLNLDEFAAGGTGVNAWFGRCKNPLDERRITGGSSSGSAAAISARFSLATIGSDAGGSIRIPAAFCGDMTDDLLGSLSRIPDLREYCFEIFGRLLFGVQAP